jgi:hypothetical protein
MACALLTASFGLAGCNTPLAALPLLARPAPDETVSVPTEEGTQYVMVETSRRTTEAALAKKWKREAAAACKGDYIVLNQGAAASRRRGVTSRRIHEGYVQCLNPEAMFAGPTRKTSAPEPNANAAGR